MVPEEFSALEAITDGWFTERAGLFGVVHGKRLRTSWAEAAIDSTVEQGFARDP